MGLATAIKVNRSVCDDRAVCIFTATESSPVRSILNLFSREHTTLVVYFSRAVVSLRRGNKVLDMDANYVIAKPRGETDVRFQYAVDDFKTNFVFSSELEAATFVGAVHLIQHLAVLPRPGEESPLSDNMLSQFTKYALDYAEELWSLVLWQKSYKFHDIVDALRSAAAELRTSKPNTSAIALKFRDLTERFGGEASMDEVVELDRSARYTMTPLAVLLAQVSALHEHATCICRSCR